MKHIPDEKLKLVFEKLSKFIGVNLKLLINRPDGKYCFREHKNRVYYVPENLLLLSSNVAGDNLISIGTCFGKFTKSGKFNLIITALTYLAPYAQHKVWLKAAAEQQFLYGHHVIKSGLGRITENTDRNQGVVIFNMSDIPLGLGVAAKSTAECKLADPLSIVCYHIADIGEYVRAEETLT